MVPGASGVAQMANLSEFERHQLVAAAERAAASHDVVVFDCGAGISHNVVSLASCADTILIVTTPEPTAITDAYAMVKLLTKHDPRLEIGLIVNDARDSDDAQMVHTQLDIAATRFLQRRLQYFGHIAHDPALREAVLVQRPVVDHVPQAPSSRCFRSLACRLAGMSQGGPGMRVVAARPPEPVATQTEVAQCA